VVLTYLLLAGGAYIFVSRLVERSRAETLTNRRDALGTALFGLMVVTIAVGDILGLAEGIGRNLVLGLAVLLALGSIAISRHGRKT
jgi:hypothetical protein